VTNSHSTFISRTERVGDIDVETDKAAVGFKVVEGRVGAFRPDDHLLHAAMAFSMGSAHGDGQGNG
jgi:hypothetical protein